jgi:hypothetical protein
MRRPTFAVVLGGSTLAFALNDARALFSFGAALRVHGFRQAGIHHDVLNVGKSRVNMS